MSGKKQKLLRRAAQKIMQPWVQKEVERRQEEKNRDRNFSGLIVEKPSRLDYIREKALGGSDKQFIAGERLKQIKESGILNHIIYQGDQNSCVSCSFTWLNMYNSFFKSANKIKLDWKYLWDLVPKEAGGSKPRDNGDILRTNGQPEINKDNPEKYKIKNYFYLGQRNYAGVLAALKDTPVIIGFYTGFGQGNLTNNNFPHAVVCIDLDEGGNYICINYWKDFEQDMVIVPKTVKLITAITIEDILDEQISLDKVRLGRFGVIKNRILYFFEHIYSNFFRKSINFSMTFNTNPAF